MDKSDIVLISIIVTIVVLAVGGISACVILLVVKWKDFIKRRQWERINVAPADGTETRDNEELIRVHAPPPYSAPPSPARTPSDYPPPEYTAVDTGTPQVTRRNDENRNSQENTENVTISYSPPPPYTILPPRCLITREGIPSRRGSMSRPSSMRPTGIGHSSHSITPEGIMFSLPNSRQPSGHATRVHGSPNVSAGLMFSVANSRQTSSRSTRGDWSRNISRQTSAATNSIRQSAATTTITSTGASSILHV